MREYHRRCEIDRQLGYGKYDIMAANLLAEIIVMMADCFIPHLKNTGILITSWHFEEKKDKVIKKVLKMLDLIILKQI